MLVEEFGVRADKSLDAYVRWRARPERRRSVEDRRLQLALLLVQQCDREAALVAEPAVEGALADASGGRYVVHRHFGHSALGEQSLGGGQHLQPVPGRVGPFDHHAGAEHGQAS